MPLRTNEPKLVMMAVQGKVAHAAQWAYFEVSHDGKPFALPSTGSITYNVRVGDPAFGWAGDHIEAGVSTTFTEGKSGSPKHESGFNFLSCIGNDARVVSGEAKGSKGKVLGTHGGVEHVMIDFAPPVLEKLTLDDKILIKAYGQGLQLLDFPDVKVYSLDPRLLKKINPKSKGKKLLVPVTTVVPAEVMGSGIGSLNIGTGDYDIMTHDPETVRKYKIDQICFGDLVAIRDHDNSYGRTFKRGAVSIGVVVHSNCLLAGHGPGVTTIMTSAVGAIEPFIDSGANIGRYLNIGRYQKKSRRA